MQHKQAYRTESRHACYLSFNIANVMKLVGFSVKKYMVWFVQTPPSAYMKLLLLRSYGLTFVSQPVQYFDDSYKCRRLS